MGSARNRTTKRHRPVNGRGKDQGTAWRHGKDPNGYEAGQGRKRPPTVLLQLPCTDSSLIVSRLLQDVSIAPDAKSPKTLGTPATNAKPAMAHASKQAQEKAVSRAKQALPKNPELRREVLELLQGELQGDGCTPSIAQRHDQEAAQLVLESLGEFISESTAKDCMSNEGRHVRQVREPPCT